MAVTHENLEIVRGDDKYYNITFRDEAGDPIDITEWTVYFTVKDNFGDIDDDALIQVIVTDHTDPTAGKTQVHLGHTDTEQDHGEYKYDIQIKKPAGVSGEDDIITVMKGDLVICPDVTRRTS